MSTRGVADVVFCLDASGSMQPCIDSVKAHISDFVDGLRSGNYASWDLRMDFVAYSAPFNMAEIERIKSNPFEAQEMLANPAEFEKRIRCGINDTKHKSLHYDDCRAALYSGGLQAAKFFTSNVDDIKRGLDGIVVDGDEAALVGLDFALDFPWRQTAACHRVVIMLTDEPLEGGIAAEQQMARLADVIEKIHRLGVMLFLVAPDSPGFDQLSAADRSEWEVVDDTANGLGNIDFRKVLGYTKRLIIVLTSPAKYGMVSA